ncbi:glycosyltransferase family 4 protein [Streptococcus parauberis]|uniref:Glycosyltransferase family 4 protein n=1 Tax=Streptococcus parauberis TaxID=1348 RepID=A0AAE4HYV1_9STRE|nr:glycosyltransferase family 4 protein [Streptococcus parauberis]MDT2732473.1 glycosyltransferase family 4 protein [Streptococcus parauberis]
MKKALITATTAYMISQFNIKDIKRLIDCGFKVEVAANFENPGPLNQEKYNLLIKQLNENGIKYFHIPFSRNPISKDNLKAYFQLKSIIDSGNFDLVHTHTPIAGLLTRLIIKNKSLYKIYTAHGFHFYKGAPILNWLLYYPLEKLMSKYTDVLVTMNEEDYQIAKNNFTAKTVKKINGVGIDLDKFQSIGLSQLDLFDELKIDRTSFLVLSIGELNDNKNHMTVIKAIQRLANPMIKYIIVGTGVNYSKYQEYIRQHRLENNVFLLGYRDDIAELLKTTDLFIFPSYREGLSVALMEAMASGLPIIASNIRGNKDLVIQEKGGILVSPESSEEFASAIQKLYNDSQLMSNYGEFNVSRIQDFSNTVVDKQMYEIYNLYPTK